jgi:hypothetical protein
VLLRVKRFPLYFRADFLARPYFRMGREKVGWAQSRQTCQIFYFWAAFCDFKRFRPHLIMGVEK